MRGGRPRQHERRVYKSIRPPWMREFAERTIEHTTRLYGYNQHIIMVVHVDVLELEATTATYHFGGEQVEVVREEPSVISVGKYTAERTLSIPEMLGVLDACECPLWIRVADDEGMYCTMKKHGTKIAAHILDGDMRKTVGFDVMSVQEFIVNDTRFTVSR